MIKTVRPLTRWQAEKPHLEGGACVSPALTPRGSERGREVSEYPGVSEGVTLAGKEKMGLGE